MKNRRRIDFTLPPQYYGLALITEGRWAGRTVYVDNYPTDKSALVYFVRLSPLPFLGGFRGNQSAHVRVSTLAPMRDNEWVAYEYEYGP